MRPRCYRIVTKYDHLKKQLSNAQKENEKLIMDHEICLKETTHERRFKHNSNREEVALSAQRCAKPNSNQEEVALSAQGCAKPTLVQRGLR
ncbi:hypothetical protein JHK85_001305 [Glycine max]|nr:hypothetical protein JHK85_001305 [Glycine max]